MGNTRLSLRRRWTSPRENAALGRALEAVRTHQGEERESARLRLLELFEIIGATSPEVAQARRRLASLLY